MNSQLLQRPSPPRDPSLPPLRLFDPYQPQEGPASASPRKMLRRDLAANVADGAAFNLMVGLGETYIAAYMYELKASVVAIGLITTLPMLLGALLQMITPWAMRRVGSPKRWVLGAVGIQAASLLPLPLAAWCSPTLAWWVVFASMSVYWASGLAAGPAWNVWMERSIPRSIRARFFAHRVRICQLALLAGFLGGGLSLNYLKAWVDPRTVFIGMFLLSAIARVVSQRFLSMQSEVPGPLEPPVSLPELLKRLRGATMGRLLAYLLSVQVGVYIAAPFFVPYMLDVMKLTYADYAMLLSMGYLGKVVSLPWCGRFAKRFGARPLLWIGGLGIVPMSAGWLVSNDIPYLVGLQLAAGAVWAAYELAMFLMFFEAIPRSERAEWLTLYNLGNSLAIVTGSVIAALMFRGCQGELTWLVEHTLGWHLVSRWGNSMTAVFLGVFLLSTLARLVALVLLARIPRLDVHLVGMPSTRTVAVTPNAGSIEQPILPSLEETE